TACACAPSTEKSGHYVNVRYGYSVSYPDNLFVAEPESDSGDGRVFRARRGDTQFRVWGNWKLDQTPSGMADQAEEECARHPAEYRVVKAAMAAVSCVTKGGEITYEKAIIHDDAVAFFSMTYSAGERSSWDPVVSQIGGSLKALPPAR